MPLTPVNAPDFRIKRVVFFRGLVVQRRPQATAVRGSEWRRPSAIGPSTANQRREQQRLSHSPAADPPPDPQFQMGLFLSGSYLASGASTGTCRNSCTKSSCVYMKHASSCPRGLQSHRNEEHIHSTRVYLIYGGWAHSALRLFCSGVLGWPTLAEKFQ